MIFKSISKLIVFTVYFLVGTTVGQEIYAQKSIDSSVIPQVVRVKLKPDAERAFLTLQQSNRSDGTLQMGQATLDEIYVNHNVLQMKRVFPYSQKFEERHRKHGLHLWYEFTYSTNQNPEIVAQSFKKYDGFEIAKCVHHMARPNEKPKPIDPSELVKRMTTDDLFLEAQWHYHNTGQTNGTEGADISLFEAWETTMGSDQVIVAIMDGGIDYSHTDLENNMWINTGEIPGNGIDDDGNGYIDDVYGFNFVDNNGSIDPDPHGTHVAGTVSASNNNGIGVAGVAGGDGVIGGARLMSCEVFSPYNNGGFAQAFVYAADNGAVIAQNSWGHTVAGIYDQEILDAVDYFIEEAGQYEGSPMQGGIVFFAAGNSDSDADYYPGYYEPIVAVGATNHENQKSWYSNYGDWVDVSAPGGETFVSSEGILSTLPFNSYGFYQGTSMACPHVSGVAALVLSNLSSPITSGELRELLESSIDSIDDGLPVIYKGKMGTGLLNASKALDAAPVQFDISPLHHTVIIKQGESQTQTISILNESDTTFTFEFSSLAPFASISSDPIEVAPNSSASIDIVIDVANLSLGSYDLDIIASINETGKRVLRWVVEVVEDPQFVADSEASFGDIYLGYNHTQYIEFVNTTYSYLVLTDFNASLPDYMVGVDSLIIKPNSNAMLEVVFTPVASGNRSTSLTMRTNDPNQPTYAVNLYGTGNGNIPPTAVVPDSIILHQSEPSSDSYTFQLANEGDDLLSYSINTVTELKTQQLLASKFLKEELHKGQESSIQGRPTLFGFGTDNEGEYSWVDSKESSNVTFDWIDLSNDPEATVYGSGDDDTRTYYLSNFQFAYYDNIFSRLEISYNGTIGFSNSYSSFDYKELPSTYAQGNLLAPYWRDLYANAIYVREYDNYVVVQFDGYYFSNTSQTVEFEVILHSNGNIKFQYKDVGEIGYSIGIQNEDSSKGFSIAYNTEYLEESMAILIRNNTFIKSINPENGNVAGHSSQPIQINYDTEHTYEKGSSSQAIFMVRSNDPSEAIKEVFFEVQYGGPIVKYHDSSFSYVSYVDSVKSGSLKLYNDGYLPLEITDIVSSSQYITIEQTELTIAPKDSMTLSYNFWAPLKGKYTETISFSTNDESKSSVSIDLEYFIWNAYPHLVLSHQPDSIFATVLRDSITTQEFTLTNEGEDIISYTLGVRKIQNVTEDEFSLPRAIRTTKQSIRKGLSSKQIPEEYRRGTFTNTRKQNINQDFVVPEKAAFGYLYDYSLSEFGHASMIPEEISSLTKYSTENYFEDFIGAGEYITSLNKYIEFSVNGDYYVIDPETEEVVNQGKINLYNINGAAYNVSSDELYLCNSNQLYKFNLQDHTLSEVGNFGSSQLLMISLSFGATGDLYGIDIINSVLMKIDPSTAETEEIGYIGFETNFGSGLAWDGNRMIMAAYNWDTGNFDFRQVDLQSGNTEIINGELGGNYQFGWIAFQLQGTAELDITEGTLLPGASQKVSFSLVTNGMQAGDYLYGIDVNSNDQLNPYRQIPALISVLDLTPSRNVLDFDSVANGYHKALDMYVINQSSHAINLEKILSTNSIFTVESQSGILQPKDSVALTVTFKPTEDGTVVFDEYLEIYFEGVVNRIPLKAKSYDNTLPEVYHSISDLEIEKNAFKVIDLREHFYDYNADTIHYDIEIYNVQSVEAAIENNNQLVIYGKQQGEIELIVKASDILGTITESFMVTVTDPGYRPPVIIKEVSKLVFNANSSIDYDISEHFNEQEEGLFSYTFELQNDSNLDVQIDSVGNITINSSISGNEVLHVKVSDGQVETTLSVPVEVLPENEPNILLIGETFLIGLDTLIEEENLEYSYSFDTAGIVALYEENNLLNIYALEEGEVNVSILATNGMYTASLDYTFSTYNKLEVTNDNAFISLREGDSTTYDFSDHFTYNGENTVQVEWESLGIDNVEFTNLDESKVSILGILEGLQNYTITLSVGDQSVSINLEVEVTEKNYAPELSQDFNDLVLELGEFKIVNLDEYFTDLNGDSIEYSIGDFDTTLVDASITNDNRLIIFTLLEGTATLPLNVTDGELSLELEVTVIVNKPIINGIINESPTGVSLYPNPATTTATLIIEVEKPTSILLELMDLTGRKIRSESWNKVPQGAFQYSFDVSNLVSGTYIIGLTAEDGQTLFKRLSVQ
ncbi:S8 family serine peptidase [Flammeovirga sp. OC4]|uniref:S8 family serine peptidase n=1 Tax=Flammeovirga sp. OC4 TaxID=1382345 RepID=UPI0005C65898|nr:S8 family serine peptidase [Flammeovirga sp. OC4]